MSCEKGLAYRIFLVSKLHLSPKYTNLSLRKYTLFLQKTQTVKPFLQGLTVRIFTEVNSFTVRKNSCNSLNLPSNCLRRTYVSYLNFTSFLVKIRIKIRYIFKSYFSKKLNLQWTKFMSKYKTISSESVGEFRDKGSKFLAYAYPVRDEKTVAQHLEILKKEHPKARHWCYAWRMGLDKNNYRANDDGEPSGTAGRPILGQIDSFGLTNVLIIVVRYFGGTLLGTSGLIQAYRESASDALSQAIIVEKTVCDFYQFTFDYTQMPDVMNALKKMDLEVLNKDFGEKGNLQIAIPIDKIDETLLRFKALVLKKTEEEAALQEEIEGVSWEYVYTF